MSHTHQAVESRGSGYSPVPSGNADGKGQSVVLSAPPGVGWFHGNLAVTLSGWIDVNVLRELVSPLAVDLYYRLGRGKDNVRPRARFLEEINAERMGDKEKGIRDNAMRGALEELRQVGVLILSGNAGWCLAVTDAEAGEAIEYLAQRERDLKRKREIAEHVRELMFRRQEWLGPLFLVRT